MSSHASWRPLPLRRGFWSKYPKLIREGVVLLAENMPEREDIRNAAQAILIGEIETRLMRDFKRPALSQEGDMYAEFFDVYMRHIEAEELRIWEEFAREMDQSLSHSDGRACTALEAAYLSYAMLGFAQPPQSQELYMNLAVFARAYEQLMQRKYGDQHTRDLYYHALRKHMPMFLRRLIGMSSLMSMLLTMNAKSRELVDETVILRPDTALDPRFLMLDDEDSMGFLPKYIEVMREHIQKQGITEDSVGRTEDRGCPVLYASERDAIIRFSIEELIAQHASFADKTRPRRL